VIRELGEDRVPTTYGGQLTVAMARSKLDEHKLRDAPIDVLPTGQRKTCGPFEIELIHLTHSIPDMCAVALHTELGTVLITGDYKFDQTPVSGAPADVARLAELGREGVLLLYGDSTNADRPGWSTSESVVGPELERQFARCRGRIVVTSFASNIHRVQQVVHAAQADGRKVCLVGRSMRKNTNIARTLEHIVVPDGILIQPRELDQFPDDKIVIISTGSQGEPLSALRRMAYNDHPAVELKPGDTVFFSATPIPGNERAVNETIDRLFHIGCDVVTARDVPIHTSGHGYQEEMKLMLNLTRPRYVLPAHGDFKRIHLHAQIAEAVGVPPEQIFKGANGLPLEIDGSRARFAEREQSGMVFVDGVDIGDVADVALRDRRMLSGDGILVIVATVKEEDGSSVVPPEVIARGVPFLSDGEAPFVDELREAVEDSLDRAAEQHVTEIEVLERFLHDDLASFIYGRLKRRPMVLPVVVEV
jgi:ribonuclease J